MVKAYIRSKKQIVIALDGLYRIREAIQGFVLEDKIEVINTFEDDWDPESLSTARYNLVSPAIISIFPNATSIIINTGLYDHEAFPFDMFYILKSMTKISNWNSIKIKQQVDKSENYGKGWISKVWNLSGEILVREYKECGVKLSYDRFERTINTRTKSHESFEIARI